VVCCGSFVDVVVWDQLCTPMPVAVPILTPFNLQTRVIPEPIRPNRLLCSSRPSNSYYNSSVFSALIEKFNAFDASTLYRVFTPIPVSSHEVHIILPSSLKDFVILIEDTYNVKISATYFDDQNISANCSILSASKCYVLFSGGVDSLHAALVLHRFDPTRTVVLFNISNLNSRPNSEKSLIIDLFHQHLEKQNMELEFSDFPADLRKLKKEAKAQTLSIRGKKKEWVNFQPKESLVKNVAIGLFAAERVLSQARSSAIYIPLDDEYSSHICDRPQCFHSLEVFIRKRYGLSFTLIGTNMNRRQKIQQIQEWGGGAVYNYAARLSCFSRCENSNERCTKCQKCVHNISVEFSLEKTEF